MSYNASIEEENKEIAARYKDLLKDTYKVLSKEDKVLIRKAFEISLEAHSTQRRKTGEPYIFHPIAVAKIVAKEIGLGATSIAAALLHDVVEDTEYTIEDIERLFGEAIAKIVDGLTKFERVKTGGDFSIQAENIKKIFLTLHDGTRAILIKIADRLHNMQTMDAMPAHKQVKIASETLYIYAPLAHRLGMWKIKKELEDLGLKYTNPEAYNNVLRKMAESEGERREYLDNFVEGLKERIDKEVLVENDNFKYEIKSRAKSIYSIYRKMEGKKVSYEEVFDKYGIRIVFKPVKLVKDSALAWWIYSAVRNYCGIQDDERLRDWIISPRPTGYQALHTTVKKKGLNQKWVEVQIRSEEMNEIAEKGYAAHHKYKQGASKSKDTVEQWLDVIKEILEDENLTDIDFVEEVRRNIFKEEIYVYTPKGDVKCLPHDASVLDFAFSIHTDVGMRCKGVKVNGRLVPLNHTLKNGVQVEVMTSTKSRPNRRWLDIVITSKARAKIKIALKEEEKKIAEEGKAVLMRKLRRLKITFNDRTVNQLVSYFQLKRSSDLFFRFGSGAIDNSELKAFAAHKNSKFIRFFRNRLQRSPSKNYINGGKTTYKDALVFGEKGEKLEYKMSKCCNSISGDSVFGFVTINDGIKIHKKNCPNAISLHSKYSHRIISARWVGSAEQDFRVILNISGIDNAGIVNSITGAISNDVVHMDSLNIAEDNGVFDGKIGIRIKNIFQLNKIIEKIRRIDGVQKVERS